MEKAEKQGGFRIIETQMTALKKEGNRRKCFRGHGQQRLRGQRGSDEGVTLGEVRSVGRYSGNRSPRGYKEWGMKRGEVKP